MAWKFIQEFSQDGDVVEPSEWRININEMLSELNGFLDSDNLGRNTIDKSMVKRNTFTQVYSNDLNPTYSYVFDHEASGWMDFASAIQEGDNDLNMNISPASLDAYRKETPDGTKDSYLSLLDSQVERLPSVTFDADQDGLLICEFSGWVDWMHQSTNTNDMSRHGPDYDPYYEGHRRMQYGFFAQQTKNFKHLSSFVLCSMWRIIVNGQVVAETGPLGCDYSKHPIYLCGTTPITKGTSIVVQLQGQMAWWSHGAEQMLPSASFNPLEHRTNSWDHGTFSGATSNESYTYRMDCSLNSPTLIVTHRKR